MNHGERPQNISSLLIIGLAFRLPSFRLPLCGRTEDGRAEERSGRRKREKHLCNLGYLAQLVEHLVYTEKVSGSTPLVPNEKMH